MIAPNLADEIGLSPIEIGLLSSVYLLRLCGDPIAARRGARSLRPPALSAGRRGGHGGRLPLCSRCRKSGRPDPGTRAARASAPRAPGGIACRSTPGWFPPRSVCHARRHADRPWNAWRVCWQPRRSPFPPRPLAGAGAFLRSASAPRLIGVLICAHRHGRRRPARRPRTKLCARAGPASGGDAHAVDRSALFVMNLVDAIRPSASSSGSGAGRTSLTSMATSLEGARQLPADPGAGADRRTRCLWGPIDRLFGSHKLPVLDRRRHTAAALRLSRAGSERCHAVHADRLVCDASAFSPPMARC